MNYLRIHNPLIQILYPAPTEADDLEKIISTSFDLALNLESFVAMLTTQGPFFIPAVKFKKRLLKILNISTIDKYSFIDTKKSKFLQIKEGLNTHLVSLTPPYLQISYAKKGNSKTLLNEFPELLLNNFSPYIKKRSQKRKTESNMEISAFENSTDPFIYLDLIIDPKRCQLGNDYFEIYKKSLTDYYKDNAQTVGKQSEKLLQSVTKLHTKLYKTCLTNKKRIEREKLRRKKLAIKKRRANKRKRVSKKKAVK
jgi:hypothetical protein